MQEVEEFEVKTSELEHQLKESEEKLQLVVEFPSIDAKQSAQSQSDKGVMFNGEGPCEAEVAQDMERQVMANNVRIMTLEEQNEKLRKSIAFLMNARESISKKKVGAYWGITGQVARNQSHVARNGPENSGMRGCTIIFCPWVCCVLQ